jgi:hypothetical protein
MEIFCCTGILIIIMIILFSAPDRVSRWQRSRVSAKWQELAQSNGLLIHADDDELSVKMSGPWNGRTVQVEVHTIITGGIRGPNPRFPTWEHLTEISVELKPKSLESELALSAHSLFISLVNKIFDSKDIYTKTSDEAFNKRFQIMGTNVDFCEKALADPMIRAGLIATKKSATIKLNPDLNSITYSAPGMESNVETLAMLFTLFTNWADKIESIKSE